MPKVNVDDTIAALSTPPGEGGIAVIRVSGREAIILVDPLFRSITNGVVGARSPRPAKGGETPPLRSRPSHTIHHGLFVDGGGKVLDEVLVSLFRAPHSYTGEEVVEISSHGGIRVTRAILESLYCRGARPAEPGEFTKRAFLNGKMDLTQAEAVLDLIRAKSDASLAAALGQLQGNLSGRIQRLKETLLKISAHLEAGLDFPDERLEVETKREILARLGEVLKEIESLIASFQRGSIAREGILAVIIGRPNVGKSSLLNALLEKERALVSPIPGTTRDTLEEMIEIGGFAVRLVDTAGLTARPKDELDQMGIERTRRYLEQGQLFLFVVDATSGWGEEDEKIYSEIRERNVLIVLNKIDLVRDAGAPLVPCPPLPISCLTGEGLPELLRRLEDKVVQLGGAPESATLTRLRYKQALERAQEALLQSKKGIEEEISPELALEDLRVALNALRELIGEVYSEELLDVIFREFCIGK